MSRLDDLIQEYCPDGVPFVKIKDYFTRLKGTPITARKMKEIASEDGEIKIFAGGKTIIDAHEADIPKANITTVPAVLVQSRGVIDFVYYDKPFTFKNEMWAYTHEDITTVKYLYYVLSNDVQYFREKASGMGSLPQISTPVTEEYKVPLPALPVQREIVRILDEFTLLSAELAAELAARKKQYEYYRDELLTFGDEIEWKTLDGKNGIAVIKGGKDYKHLGEGTVPIYGSGGIMGSCDTSIYNKPTVLIPRKGSISNIFYVDGPFWNVDTIFYTEINDNVIMPKFLFHWICNYHVEKLNTSNAARPALTREILKGIPVPIPSMEEQQKIVRALDTFENVCTDMFAGLPAEIEARQKQYEYYRDQLLTFKELK